MNLTSSTRNSNSSFKNRNLTGISQLELSVYRMKIVAETDYMDEVITQRKKDITQIENIMNDIHTIAQDIALETTKQGEKV